MLATFEQAFNAARRHYDAYGWAALDPRQRTEAIYREMRRIDRAAVNGSARLAASVDTKVSAAADSGHNANAAPAPRDTALF